MRLCPCPQTPCMFTQLKTFMNFCFSLLIIISSQLVAHVQQTFRCPKTATVFGLCLSFASSVPLGHRAKDEKLLLVAEFTRTSDWDEPWSYRRFTWHFVRSPARLNGSTVPTCIPLQVCVCPSLQYCEGPRSGPMRGCSPLLWGGTQQWASG